jgi:hypothetical protein
VSANPPALTPEQEARRNDATVTAIDTLLGEVLSELKATTLRWFVSTDDDDGEAEMNTVRLLEGGITELVTAQAMWIVDGASPIARLAEAARYVRTAERDHLSALADRVASALGLTPAETTAIWTAPPSNPGASS